MTRKQVRVMFNWSETTKNCRKEIGKQPETGKQVDSVNSGKNETTYTNSLTLVTYYVCLRLS